MRPSFKLWRRGVLTAGAVMAAYAVAVAVLLLAVGTEAGRARRALTRAEASVARADPVAAAAALDVADAHLAAATDRGRAWPLRLLRSIPLVGSPVKGFAAGARAGREMLAAGRIAVTGAEGLFPVSDAVVGPDLTGLHRGAADSGKAIDRAVGHLHAARDALEGPAGAVLPPVSALARRFRDEVTDRITKLDVTRRAVALTGELTAPDRQVRLLFLSQDSMELRPTGGLVGSFGILTITGGRAELTHFADVGTLPAPDPPLEPPASLAPTVERWVMPNVGWSPDFPTSARIAAEMYRRAGNEQVDGVVAMTEGAIARLLKAVGPVMLPSYPEPVTGEGFAERVIYETNLKQPRDEPRKKFLLDLSDALFGELLALPRAELPDVLEALGASAAAGDIGLWFENPEWQARLRGTAVQGALPPPSGDIVQLAEANMTAGKANLGLTRDIDYTVKRRRDGRLVGRLAIHYRNDAPKSEVNPYYHGLLRVYVPRGVERVLFNGTVSDAPEGPYSVLTQPVVVAPDGGTAEVVFEYLLPDTVMVDGQYRLTVVRQPGTTRDRYTVTVGDRTARAVNGERRIQIEAGGLD